MSVLGVVSEFLRGNIDLSQHFKNFEYIDGRSNREGYKRIERLDDRQEFSLKYEGHYRAVEVILSRDILATSNKGNADWYLNRLVQCGVGDLRKQLDKLSSEQLIALKESYIIEAPGDGKKYILSSEAVIIERLKEQLMRLVAVNPNIKYLLDNRSTVVRNDSLQDKVIASRLPEKISNFIGREEVFARIDEILSINQCVAINAMPGAGKSTTALEYGHRQESRNREGVIKIVRWFNSNSSYNLEIEYKQLASDLGINDVQNKEALIRSVNNAITKLGKPMLFIFNDLENYQDIREYLANLPQNQVKVIITTRDNSILKDKDNNILREQHIELQPFSKQEAQTYIKNSLVHKKLDDRTSNEVIEDIIKILCTSKGEVLPHRLSRAVVFFNEDKRLTIKRCLEKFKTSFDDQAETALLIQLVEKSPLAWQILQYAAFLDSGGISIEIFKEIFSVDEDNLRGPLNKLEQLSLLNLDYLNGQPFYKIHRLVQEEIKKYIDRRAEQSLSIDDIYNNLIISLNNIMPEVTEMPDEKWQTAILFYPHLNKLLENCNKYIAQVEQGSLYTKLGKYNEFINCNFEQSLKANLVALEIHKNLYKEAHPDIANSLDRVGTAHHALGEVRQGLQFLEPALEMRQELYQGNHPDIANSFSHVGTAYYDLGNIRQGIQYQTEALNIYEKLSTQEQHYSSSMAQLLDHLGISYQKLGDAEQALHYFNKSLEIYKKLYKGDNQFTAKAFNHLGQTYQDLNDLNQALSNFNKSLSIYRSLCEAEHPLIANLLNNIGIVYYTSNDSTRAFQNFEQALKIYKSLYKEAHPDKARTLNNIGSVYQKLGNSQKGLQFYKEALDLLLGLYDDNNQNPVIANILNNLGTGYYSLNDVDQALQCFRKSYYIYKKLYQENHPDIARSLSNIGLVYQKLEALVRALEYQKQALTIKKNVYVANHFSIADSLSIIGNIYQIQGNNNEAIKYQKQALTIKQNLHRKDYLEIANLLCSIGNNYRKLKNFDQALRYYEEVFNLPEQDIKLYVGVALNNIGEIYYNLGKIEECQKYFNQALSIYQILYQGNHKDIAKLWHYMGMACYAADEIEAASNFFEHALTMYQKLYNSNHSYIAKSLNNLGLAYKALGDNVKATELFKQSYLMYIKLLGENHCDTRKIAEILKNNDIILETVQLYETRIMILTRGSIDNGTLKIKQKIQEEILNKIHIQSAKGNWSSGLFISTASFLGDWGVKGYLDNEYLEEKLGNLVNSKAMEVAKMLCFEAICLGIMSKSSTKKNLTCIQEFKKAYPELLAKIIAEHPEYMVDGLIVRECVSDPEVLKKLLGENFSGRGLEEYAEENPWMIYTKEGMEEILKLRLESIGNEEEIKVIIPNYIWDGSIETAEILAAEISFTIAEKSLVVLNLYGKHWVGIALDKKLEADTINISYIDSERNEVPSLLKTELIKQIAVSYPGCEINFTEVELELQKYNNCGLEVIENLIAHIAAEERTVTQEDALVIHSLLLEDSLLLGNSNSTSLEV